MHAVAAVLLSSPPVAMFCWTYVMSSIAGARAQHCHLGSFEPRENWEQHVWSAHAHAQLARSHFTNSFNVWMDLACTALLAVAYCYSNKVEISDQLSLSQHWDGLLYLSSAVPLSFAAVAKILAHLFISLSKQPFIHLNALKYLNVLVWILLINSFFSNLSNLSNLHICLSLRLVSVVTLHCSTLAVLSHS